MIFSTAKLVQIDVVFGGHFGEAQRVGRRAEHGRGLRCGGLARSARLLRPPPGITRAPRATSASNALQKPTNGPNENASNARSLGVIVGGVEHVLPGFDPPLPIVGRVDDDERPAAGAGGLVAADVALRSGRCDWRRRVAWPRPAVILPSLSAATGELSKVSVSVRGHRPACAGTTRWMRIPRPTAD